MNARFIALEGVSSGSALAMVTLGFVGGLVEVAFFGIAGVRPMRVTWDALERRHPADIRHFDATREAIEWP